MAVAKKKKEPVLPTADFWECDFVPITPDSDEWFDLRLGRLTSSRMHGAMQTKTNKGYTDLLAELYVERATGERKEFLAKATEHGKAEEGKVLAMLKLMFGHEKFGEPIFLTGINALIGGTPDTYTNLSCFEVKSPINPGVHMQRFTKGFSKDILVQTVSNAEMLGVDTAYMVSYCDLFPANQKLLIEKIDMQSLDIRHLLGDIETDAKLAESQVQKYTEELEAYDLIEAIHHQHKEAD